MSAARTCTKGKCLSGTTPGRITNLTILPKGKPREVMVTSPCGQVTLGTFRVSDGVKIDTGSTVEVDNHPDGARLRLAGKNDYVGEAIGL